MFPKGMEWIVILIVALLIFGPKNLPKLGKSLGSTVKNIREGMESDEASKDDEPVVAEEDADDDAEIRELEAKLAAAKKKKEDGDAEKFPPCYHGVIFDRLTPRASRSFLCMGGGFATREMQGVCAHGCKRDRTDSRRPPEAHGGARLA